METSKLSPKSQSPAPAQNSQLEDNLRKLEYKNLIKDKVLKPSKLAKYDTVRGHHAHLVIRDSHYLIKSPTSFITCASCHRGRVLKISTIQELTTQEILDEVYNTISKNPCSKRKHTAKEHQVIPGAEPQKRQRFSTTSYDSTGSTKSDAPSLESLSHPSHGSITSMSSGSIVPSYSLPPTSSIVHPSLHTVSQSSSQSPEYGTIPAFEDFFNDIEPFQNVPQVSRIVEINSIGSSIKVTSSTLQSLFSAQSNFPANLDCFLSQAIEHQYGPNFFTEDTLFVPLPTYAATMFSKDLNKSYFRRDESLQRVLSTRIHDFVHQPGVQLANLKIVIFFNYFQEGMPERPQENQNHKYVGNIYLLHSFTVLADSSLSFSNSRYSFNHNYTWVDSKEEAAKNDLFNELILSKLQNEVFMKTNEVALGTHVNPLVLDRPALMTVIPYSTEDMFGLTANHGLFVVCFIGLKLLQILMSDEGLQVIGYVSSVQLNSKFNLYLLKIMLETLRKGSEQNKTFRPSF